MNLTKELLAEQERNKVALRRVYEEVFVGRDLDVIDELFEPDVVFHSTALPEPARGIEEYKEFARDFLTGFSDTEVDILESVAERDIVVVRAIVSATHTGTFRGIPATGRRVSLRETVMVRGVDGRCAEAWSSFDTLGLIRQLGLFPQGEPPRAFVRVVVGLQKAGRRLSRRR